MPPHDCHHVICCHCSGLLKQTVGFSCPELRGDITNQSLCLQFQGWTQAKKRKWRCPNCSIRYCNGSRHVPASHLLCRHRQLADSSASSNMPVSSAPLPPSQRLGDETSPLHCTSIACQGCLQVCLACAPFCMTVTSPSFADRLRELNIILNSLPISCMPAFLLNPMMNESDIRVLATSLPRDMDHGSVAGSALMFLLLRPHLYMDNPVPLRLLGYPPPLEYLAEGGKSPLAGGTDDRRTVLLQALCAHWNNSFETANYIALHPTFRTTVEYALFSFQNAWYMMQLKVNIALQRTDTETANAHQILAGALQVEDDPVLTGAL